MKRSHRAASSRSSGDIIPNRLLRCQLLFTPTLIMVYSLQKPLYMKRRKKTKILSDIDYFSEADSILQDYQAILGKKLAMDLHMFFSPNRIPAGLTDEEVKICITLYPIRRAYVKRHYPKPPKDQSGRIMTFKDDIENPIFQKYCIESIQPPPSLPRQLIYSGKKMTRARFRKGIYNFLVQVSEA